MKTSFFGWAMGIVAVSALVACGDDGTGTGGGGQGGDGQGGATTSTTTTTGDTTTTTTTTTGGEGGGEGEGGEGGGTPLDCTEITLEDLENASQQGVGFILGTVSPNLGEDLVDNGQIEVYDDGENFDGATPGTFDLAEEADYATCSRCVRVREDVAEDGTFARQYFQAGGTFELAEEGNIISAGFGTVTLTDVTLVEVEIDPETFESTPVPGGACLHIASAEYDNPKIVPEEWTCDPTFYEAADGCDCDCGAYDPDCDTPSLPSGVFGCTAELPYCDATGACAEAPTWWTCDAAEINDGATCNCMCGGPDPDCDTAADLPVDGCPNVNQTCSADGTMCLNPESVCDDFTDNDNDGSFDCADASSCQGTPACTPGLVAQNGACDASNDCLALLDPLCVTDENLGVNFGFCSQWCNLENDDCGGNEFCLDLGVDEGICLTTCTEAGDECPADFACAEVAEGVFGCIPDAPAGWTCDPGFYNANDGCDCGCGVVDLDCADANDTSCDFCSEDSCGNDGTELGCDLALVDDDNNAVCN